MTARWPLVIFYNLVDIAAYNGYVLWMETFTSWNEGKLFRRRLFLNELGHLLVKPIIEKRKGMPRIPCASAIVRQLQSANNTSCDNDVVDVTENRKRGRCHLCPRKDDRKTKLSCSGCKQFCCSDHLKQLCQNCAK